jgi:hypothetical protein
MPAWKKRTHEEVIDLTADSSDVECSEPARKNARMPVIVNDSHQSNGGAWVENLDENDDEELDTIDLSQEVDNNGIGFTEIGRIGDFYSLIPFTALLSCFR